MQESKISVSREILNFLTGVYYEKGKEDIASRKERIFDRAFYLAYKDMATHTVAYYREEYEKYIQGESRRCAENRKKVREAIKNYIKKWFIKEETEDYSLTELFDINPEDFDKWHRNLCEEIVTIQCSAEDLEAKDKTKNTVDISRLLCHTDKNIKGVFTYGQAQKLVNMMLKYLYIYYQCEGWNELDDLCEKFHVPIDSYVLKAFSQKDRFEGKAWSKFTDYEKEYMACQKQIENFAAEKGYPNAFKWELAEWPFGMNI